MKGARKKAKRKPKPKIIHTKLTEDQKAKEEAKKLRARWGLFCTYYTMGGATFGNATLSYAEAYDFNLDELDHEPTMVRVKGKKKLQPFGPSEYDRQYAVCSANGHRLLRNADIQDMLTKSLNDLLKEEIVDREMAKLILQDHDLGAKTSNIREFNKLRGRITKKVDHSTLGEPITGINYIVPAKTKEKA